MFEPGQKQWDNKQAVREAEIVVIGGGGAGLAAAVAASEIGVNNVIVLESRRVAGGNSALAIGPFIIGKPDQKPESLASEIDVYLRKSMNYTHWKTCPMIARKLIERAGDFVPWMETMGVKFEFDDSNPSIPPYRIIGSPRGGSIIIKALLKRCEELGIDIRCQARAKQLILDNSGKLAGVLVEENNGQINIATDIVILATGGFAGNKGLLKEYFPDFPEDVIPLRGLPHQGDGLLMAKEIGAATDGLAYLEMSMFLNLKSDLITLLAANPARLWINRRGERFTDESLISPEAVNSIYRQPGKIYYSLFDEHAKRGYLNNRHNAHQIEKDLRTCIEEDRAKITDSLDEMALWFDIPPNKLKKTIDEYNTCCDRGHDIFLKDQEYLLPIRTPPFYGIKCGISLLVTHGDLKVDHNMAVLDRKDNPISGLYAVGDDICGVDSDTYNMNLPGHSLGFAINSGRIAGENAAKSISNVQRIGLD